MKVRRETLALACLLIAAVASVPEARAQEDPGALVRLKEDQWNASIKSRDVDKASSFLADDYFLAVAVAGQPLAVVDRKVWLANLKNYVINDMRTGEMLVHAYGDVVTVSYPYFQSTVMQGHNINGDFLLTDIWVKGDGDWKVAARYSSRFGETKP